MDASIPVWILVGLPIWFTLCISVCFAMVRLCYLLFDNRQEETNVPTISNPTGEMDHSVVDAISNQHRAAVLALSNTTEQENEWI